MRGPGLCRRPASARPAARGIARPRPAGSPPRASASSCRRFVAWLKQENGKVSYASSGTDQSSHLSGAWFLQLTGTKAEHIPCRGAAPALQDLTAGVTQLFFYNLTTSIEFMRAGKLRALGITSAERNPLTPELVPICETMAELKPFDVSTWFGVFLSAGTRRPVVDSLNAQMKLWLDDPKTKERFTTMAGFPAYGEYHTLTREIILLRFGPYMAAYHEVPGKNLSMKKRAVLRLALSFFTWRTLVRESGLKPNAAAEAMVRAIDCDQESLSEIRPGAAVTRRNMNDLPRRRKTRASSASATMT